MGKVATSVAILTLLASACGPPGDSTNSASTVEASDPPPSTTAAKPSAEPAWIEEDVAFPFGSDQLIGVLTLPPDPGPHPAVVLLSGSGGTDGIRAGSTASLFVDHSRMLATEGFVVLRYDPPGVGQSSGGAAIPSLDERVEETHAAIQYVQSLAHVANEEIGLLGWSQGPWVMAMTAVRYPAEIAFLVSVVGSGQSVANQQVYGIRAQSQAAGMSEEDVAKAVLFGRLLIDWQLPEPIFEQANRGDAAVLGDGPWNTFAELVYETDDLTPAGNLEAAVEILRSVREEPWADALYLDLYLARLESLPANISPEEMAMLQTVMAGSLLTDPKDFLTEVRIPVLAFFGEDDLNVDGETSPGLFEQYLSEAGNTDYTIVVIPGVGHNVVLSTPGYWDTLSEWLRHRFINPE